ncbi:MAG TPA: class I SAM-dependent methyltransferase [Ktedonobacterales bacterium]|nr:class I SAM-dependent methyltransferase [Ktedonobacterales bacterium]
MSDRFVPLDAANALNDPYAAIAEWYDLEHDGFAQDSEFYQQVIASLGAGRAQVLEIGSGTGRLAAALALAGFGVTGVEPSAAMRARCARRLATLPPPVARRIQIVVGTATALNLPQPPSIGGPYDVAIIALGTFAHLLTDDERLRALATMRPQLRPGGQLLLDLDLAGPRAYARQPWRRLTLRGWPRLTDAAGSSAVTPTQLRIHTASGAPGPLPETVTITHAYATYEYDAPNASQGKQIAEITTTMTLALLTRAGVEQELRQAGYTIAQVYGGYDLRPATSRSARALIVARRG